MQVQFNELKFETGKKIQIIDITRDVEKFVEKSAVANGICIIHASHATAAIILNENEPGLIQDIEKKTKELFVGNYQHDKIDDNAAAHIASAFLGANKTIPIRDGKLQRGTWQSILFLELDGPRPGRKVLIEVIGD
jgi:secondary thiamine-phosphate synthase enzyme